MSDLLIGMMSRITMETYIELSLRLQRVADKYYPETQTRRTPGEGSHYNEFIRALECIGFTLLGGGHFAVVFSHKDTPGLAYKVGLKKEDSGAAYAAWARANPGPHVPRIIHISRCEAAYIVVMPEYTRFYSICADGDIVLQWDVAFPIIEGFTSSKERHHPISITAEAIRKFFEGVATFDLHQGNVMVDGANLIITDPVSFTAGVAVSD